MSEFEKLKVVARYELLKQFRRKRLYIVLGIAIAAELSVLIGLPVLGEGYPENVMTTAAMLSIGPSFATIGAVFFAGDAIAGEFERKTGYILFPNPLRRTTMIIGKYIAGYMSIGLLVLIAYGMVCVSLIGIHGQVPIETAGSLGLCLLLAGSILSLTFLFSSIAKGAMSATVMTLAFVMIVSGVLDGVLTAAGQPSWFLLSKAGDSVITIYGGYSTLIPGGAGLPEELLAGPDIGLCALAMVAYLIALLPLSICITKRREMI